MKNAALPMNRHLSTEDKRDAKGFLATECTEDTERHCGTYFIPSLCELRELRGPKILGTWFPCANSFQWPLSMNLVSPQRHRGTERTDIFYQTPCLRASVVNILRGSWSQCASSAPWWLSMNRPFATEPSTLRPDPILMWITVVMP